jgi:hypothetical protein
VWKSKFYGAFVLNHRVVLHAIDATPARWRGDAGSSPLDRAGTAASSPRNDLVKNCRVHPTHWLIYTQPGAFLSLVFLGDLRLHGLDHALGRLDGALLARDDDGALDLPGDVVERGLQRGPVHKSTSDAGA